MRQAKIIFIMIILITMSIDAESLANNGIINLSSDDLNQSLIDLNGEWLYSIDENYNPDTLEIPSNTNVFHIPKHWNSIFPDGQGTAWFFLILELPNEYNKNLTLYLDEIYTAYELYINGENIINEGYIDDNDIKNNIPSLKSSICDIVFSEKILIALKISNYHHNDGGIILVPANKSCRTKSNRAKYNCQLFHKRFR